MSSIQRAVFSGFVAAFPCCCPVVSQQGAAGGAGAPWESLFDGETLTGWRQHGGRARYAVEDGVIVGTTVQDTPNSFLCTEREFGDFELELEFKVDPGLNSGIQVRSEVGRQGRVRGYQVEIDPSERAWTAGLYDEARRGWLDDLSDNEVARRAFRQNEWNRMRMELIGDSIKTWINGVPAADHVDSMTLSGFIGLQVHGVGGRTEPLAVRWRGIRIRDLGRHEWRPTFDGKSLDGWRALPGGEWRVHDGVLIGTHAKDDPRHGILSSDARYGDFTARVRYRVHRGNSGFYFRADEVEGPVGLCGFQAEIDPQRDAGMLYETGGRGRVAVPAPADVEKWYRRDTFNEMTVSAHGRRIAVDLNGHRMAELKADPGRLEGHLGLQLHGAEDVHVEFTRIDLLVPCSIQARVR